MYQGLRGELCKRNLARETAPVGRAELASGSLQSQPADLPQSIATMPPTNLADDEALAQAENRPGRKHHDIRHAIEVANHRDERISQLQAGENAQRSPHLEAATEQDMVEVIAAW